MRHILIFGLTKSVKSFGTDHQKNEHTILLLQRRRTELCTQHSGLSSLYQHLMLFNPHKLGVHKVLRPIAKPVARLLDAAHQANVGRAVNIGDLRAVARRRSHRMVFDYLDGGADDEITLRRNKDAFSELEMHFQILAGNSPQTLDLSTNLFGRRVRLPFFGCPTAGNRMFHVQGEKAAAKAAVHHGSVYAMSSLSTTSFAVIAKATEQQQQQAGASIPKVFQLYVWRDRELVRDILAQAKEYGFEALAVSS